MFAYCLNSPIIMTDSTGNLPFLIVTMFAGAVAGAIAGGIKAAINGEDILSSVGKGALVGALIGTGVGAVAGIALAGSATASCSAVYAGASALLSGGTGAAAGTIAANASMSTGAASTYTAGTGYGSFYLFKQAFGKADPGYQWHHIVEQCQAIKSGFETWMINNTGNLVQISNELHSKISGYYSSIDLKLTGGVRMTVRDWLAGQSFEFQYQFGLDVIERYSNIVN